MAGAPVALVQKVPLFSDLERKELEQLARSFKERHFAAGEEIAREGETGVGFFLIGEGEAVVTVRGQERRRLGPGECFGETALIDDGARTATVTAETDMRCYGLTPWEFRPLVEGHADIAWKLLQTLAKRLRAAEQRS